MTYTNTINYHAIEYLDLFDDLPYKYVKSIVRDGGDYYELDVEIEDIECDRAPLYCSIKISFELEIDVSQGYMPMMVTKSFQVIKEYNGSSPMAMFVGQNLWEEDEEEEEEEDDEDAEEEAGFLRDERNMMSKEDKKTKIVIKKKKKEVAPYCYAGGKHSAPIPCGCPQPCSVPESDDEEEEWEIQCEGASGKKGIIIKFDSKSEAQDAYNVMVKLERVNCRWEHIYLNCGDDCVECWECNDASMMDGDKPICKSCGVERVVDDEDNLCHTCFHKSCAEGECYCCGQEI